MSRTDVTELQHWRWSPYKLRWTSVDREWFAFPGDAVTRIEASLLAVNVDPNDRELIEMRDFVRSFPDQRVPEGPPPCPCTCPWCR